MNTLVKEIYKNAYGIGLSVDDFVLDSNERMFAESIIQACIDACSDPKTAKWVSAEQMIKEYFGIK